MSDLAYLEFKQCLSATARGLFYTWTSVKPIFCQFIFSLILLSEHYFDKGLSNTQKVEKKY